MVQSQIGALADGVFGQHPRAPLSETVKETEHTATFSRRKQGSLLPRYPCRYLGRLLLALCGCALLRGELSFCSARLVNHFARCAGSQEAGYGNAAIAMPEMAV